MKYSKVIVILVIVLNVLFAAAVFAVTFAGMQEPSTLIVAWYAFTGTELLACAGIKISARGNTTDEDSDDEAE